MIHQGTNNLQVVMVPKEWDYPFSSAIKYQHLYL